MSASEERQARATIRAEERRMRHEKRLIEYERETSQLNVDGSDVILLFIGSFISLSFLSFLLLAIAVGFILVLYELTPWVAVTMKYLWMFLASHPLIDVLMIVVIITAFHALWNELHRPKRLVGVFDPAIILSPWIQNQLPIARVNKKWQLAFYVGWFISLMAGVGLTLLSGMVNTADFLLGDVVTAMCKLNPELYKLVESQPWLGYLLLTIVFFSFTARSLQKTFWLATCRSTAVRDDPRRNLLLLLVDTIQGWNAQIPIFNDLAESGEHQDEVQMLLLKRARLIDLMNRTEKRLAVAPLGSFPQNSHVSELPEFQELNAVVTELKREPCTREAWQKAEKEVDAYLIHTQRTP